METAKVARDACQPGGGRAHFSRALWAVSKNGRSPCGGNHGLPDPENRRAFHERSGRPPRRIGPVLPPDSRRGTRLGPDAEDSFGA